MAGVGARAGKRAHCRLAAGLARYASAPKPNLPNRPQTLALHETRVRPFAVDKLLAANPDLEVQGVPPTCAAAAAGHRPPPAGGV